MYYSFKINAPGLENTAFLFERSTIDASGDLEPAFLDHRVHLSADNLRPTDRETRRDEQHQQSPCAQTAPSVSFSSVSLESHHSLTDC